MEAAVARPHKAVDAKIAKVMALRTDTSSMIESLDAISEFYESNTIESRRSLRQSLENQNLALAKKFLSEFSHIRESIAQLEDLSENLQSTCTSIARRVTEADANMKAFVDKANDLEQKGRYYSDQSKEINSFLEKFQLSPDEIDAIHHVFPGNPQNSKKFFDALTRLKISYQECKLMVERHSYSAGFELLDVLGQHQDVAYQRLFDWVKSECETIADSSILTAGDVDATLQMAIKALKDLPMYFSQCEELVINSRRTQLVYVA